MASARPTQSALLALDGPAPMAKVAGQRKRRGPMKKRKSKRGGGAQNWRKKAQSELKLALTPGTELMARTQAALLWWCANLPRTDRLGPVLRLRQQRPRRGGG